MKTRHFFTILLLYIYASCVVSVVHADHISHIDTTFVYDTLQVHPYSWFGKNYSSVGYYTDTIKNFNGLGEDSIGTLILRAYYTDTLVACGADTVIFPSTPIGEVNVTDCDSVVGCMLMSEDDTCFLKGSLVVLRSPLPRDSVIDTVFCLPDTFMWGGQMVNHSDVYYDTLRMTMGKSGSEIICDTLYLTLNAVIKMPSYSLIDTTVLYDSLALNGFTWFGNTYFTVGEYYDTILNVDGCDSIGELILRTFYTDTIWACYNDSVIFTGTPIGDVDAALCDSMKGCMIMTYDSLCLMDAALIVWRTPEPIDSVIDSVICQGQTFDLAGIHASVSGTYYDTIRISHGPNALICDSLRYTVNLTVQDVKDSLYNDTVCYMTDVLWRGQTVSAAAADTVLYDTLAYDVTGCDSVRFTYTLHVLPAPLKDSIDTLVCYGADFLWRIHSITALKADTVLYDTVYSTGSLHCDSLYLARRVLFKYPTTGDVYDTICENDLSTRYWKSNLLDHEGDYTFDTLNVAGCDSTVTLHLHVNKNTIGAETITICDRQLPYTWHGVICESASTYVTNLTNAAGCDSTVTLTLLVNTYSDGDTVAYVCRDDMPYTWRGRTVTKEGPRVDTVIMTGANYLGCDSMLYLTLIVQDTTHVIDYDTVCHKDLPYTWTVGSSVVTVTEDKIPGVSGIADSLMLTNIRGCDSLMRYIHLTVNMETASDTADTVCRADLPSYSWHGLSVADQGQFTQVLRDTLLAANAVGCDSVVTLTLFIADATDTILYDTVCRRDLPYQWNSSKVRYIYDNNQVVDYLYDTVPNRFGCDSVIQLMLTVNDSTVAPTEYVSVCRKDLPYSWHGMDLTEAGLHRFDSVNTVGCDSIMTLFLTINDTTYAHLYDTVCEADLPYLWKDIVFTDWSGNKDTVLRYDTLNTVQCDSIIFFHLTVNDTTYGNEYDTICAADFHGFVWKDITLDAWSGSHDTLIVFDTLNSVGCDSIITLWLTVNDTTHEYRDTVICTTPVAFTWKTHVLDITYALDTVISDTLVGGNVFGCDSLTFMHVIVNDSTHAHLYAQRCEADLPFTWGLNNPAKYTVSALGINNDTVLIDTITNALGCDSIVFMHLHIDTVTYGDTAAVICDLQLPYKWYDQTCATEGTYIHTLVGANAAGCDSVVTLHLTVTNFSAGDTVAYVCRADMPYMWRGQIITAEGIHVADDTLKGANVVGCDSVIYLNLFVQDTVHKVIYDTVCTKDWDSYTWTVDKEAYSTGSATWTMATGIMDSVMLHNVRGCDSLMLYLHLTVNIETASDTADTVCRADLPSYSWHGLSVIDNGQKMQVLRDTVLNSVRCDSVITMTLVINDASADTDYAVICRKELPYIWHNMPITTEGEHHFDSVNYLGCDSLMVLYLTINDTTFDTVYNTICVDELPYMWHGIACDTDSVYRFDSINAVGCDSIMYLYLTTQVCWPESCDSLKGVMQVVDICADDSLFNITIEYTEGDPWKYWVKFTNAWGNKYRFMPDSGIVHITRPRTALVPGEAVITLPVPYGPVLKSGHYDYPRPDYYGIYLDIMDSCEQHSYYSTDNWLVKYPSWINDQHWNDVIALFNDKYNGGYTFTHIDWMRNDTLIAGEHREYIYLPHTLWRAGTEYHDSLTYVRYHSVLTRTDDGKTIPTCKITPDWRGDTNVIAEPYVTVTPTYIDHAAPYVHVLTNTEGTYWIYSVAGKLIRTGDYDPCEHNAFEIEIPYVQTMYILVFTPRHTTHPFRDAYRIIKVIVH